MNPERSDRLNKDRAYSLLSAYMSPKGDTKQATIRGHVEAACVATHKVERQKSAEGIVAAEGTKQ